MVETRNRKKRGSKDCHENHHSDSSDKEGNSPSYSNEKNYSVNSEDTSENVNQHKGKYNGICTKTLLIFLVPLVLILIYCIYSLIDFFQERESSHTLNKEEIFLNNVKILKQRFPSQVDNMWAHFLSGVKTIVADDPTKPSVFLLLHFGGDKHTSDCLTRQLADNAKKYLSNSSGDPIFLQGKDLKENSAFIHDYGSFIHKYKPDIEKKNVMVVFDLQDVPPYVVQSFHFLCDVDNPVIEKAVYVFTLKVDKESNLKSPTHIAEKTLKSLWGSLPTDIRDPLITRIAHIVLFIKSENGVPCS